jgi:hypothetical protein
MSGQWIVTLVPPSQPVPRGAAWGGLAAAWLLTGLGGDSGRHRQHDLQVMARELEHEQPQLAMELRGIAMHEASLQDRLPRKPNRLWPRLANAIARKLDDVRRHAQGARRRVLRAGERAHHRA